MEAHDHHRLQVIGERHRAQNGQQGIVPLTAPSIGAVSLAAEALFPLVQGGQQPCMLIFGQEPGSRIGIHPYALDGGDGVDVQVSPYHGLGEGRFQVVEIPIDGRLLGSGFQPGRAPFLDQPRGDVDQFLFLEIRKVAAQPSDRFPVAADVGLGPWTVDLVDEGSEGVGLFTA